MVDQQYGRWLGVPTRRNATPASSGHGQPDSSIGSRRAELAHGVRDCCIQVCRDGKPQPSCRGREPIEVRIKPEDDAGVCPHGLEASIREREAAIHHGYRRNPRVDPQAIDPAERREISGVWSA